ncbi:hypothetical protein [Hyperthermus butylicus]|uniref:hypothetical protein n=1 Tax=Hyperthermus butylicus TaxID=54248 RepID=UPI00129A71E2|nr:hypothetical protein [Hyperthermus butylicus]
MARSGLPALLVGSGLAFLAASIALLYARHVLAGLLAAAIGYYLVASGLDAYREEKR